MRRILIAEQLIDGTGAPTVPNGALILDDGRIEAVTTRDQLGANPEGEVIELAGGTIMPGFIEVHAHMHCSAEADAYEHIMTETHDELLMRSVDAVRTTLASGVTTMRDLGSRNEIAFPVKQAVLDGKIPGPRLLVTGTPITTTAGHCNSFGTEADTVEQVVTAVRQQIKLGADYIKIMSTGGAFTPRSNVRAAQYPVSTLRAAVEDAERMGVRVAAHCHGTVGVTNCAEAGIHNLIHSTWLSENPDESWDYKPEVADMMAEKGLWVDPTIAIAAIRDTKGVEMDPGATSAVLDDPELVDLEQKIASTGRLDASASLELFHYLVALPHESVQAYVEARLGSVRRNIGIVRAVAEARLVPVSDLEVEGPVDLRIAGLLMP